MSKKRSDASRRAALRARSKTARADDGYSVEGYSDEAFGITARLMSPEARTTQLEVRWRVDREPWLALAGLARLREGVLDGLELELVAELRAGGYAWDLIGSALGVTGEAVRLRLKSRIEP